MPESTLAVRDVFAELLTVYARAADSAVTAEAVASAWSNWVMAEAIPEPGRPPGELVHDRILDEEQGYGTDTWSGVRAKVGKHAESLRHSLDGHDTSPHVMMAFIIKVTGNTFLCPIPP